jgi:hypothetical protein
MSRVLLRQCADHVGVDVLMWQWFDHNGVIADMAGPG